MKYFIIYLLVVNVYGFITMFIDKKKSMEDKWRIPESSFFVTSLILGSAGVLAGMYTFHHKTKHIKFVLGIPIILICQICLFYCVWKHFSFI